MLCTSAFTDGVVCAKTGQNRRNERRHCGVVVHRLTPLLRRAVDVCGGQVDEEPAQVGARPASGREHDDRQDVADHRQRRGRRVQHDQLTITRERPELR